jgi:hypothetical protein
VIGASKKLFGVKQLLASGRYRGRRVIQEAVSDTHSDEIQRVWSATAEVELRPLPLATLSISSSASTAALLSKRFVNATREEKRVKVEPRVETAMKIAQHLGGSLERSIGGLSSQVGELVAALKPDGQQAERLMKVEGKLSTAEGALVKIEEKVFLLIRQP